MAVKLELYRVFKEVAETGNISAAAKNLYISHYGYPSDYLDAFKSNCSHIDISTSVASQSTTNNNKNNPWGF